MELDFYQAFFQTLEKNPNSRKLANVSNLPTFAFFKNGKLVNELQTNKADVLLNFVDEAANH